jgi:hypothetical protein
MDGLYYLVMIDNDTEIVRSFDRSIIIIQYNQNEIIILVCFQIFNSSKDGGNRTTVHTRIDIYHQYAVFRVYLLFTQLIMEFTAYTDYHTLRGESGANVMLSPADLQINWNHSTTKKRKWAQRQQKNT